MDSTQAKPPERPFARLMRQVRRSVEIKKALPFLPDACAIELARREMVRERQQQEAAQ